MHQNSATAGGTRTAEELQAGHDTYQRMSDAADELIEAADAHFGVYCDAETPTPETDDDAEEPSRGSFQTVASSSTDNGDLP